MVERVRALLQRGVAECKVLQPIEVSELRAQLGTDLVANRHDVFVDRAGRAIADVDGRQAEGLPELRLAHRVLAGVGRRVDQSGQVVDQRADHRQTNFGEAGIGQGNQGIDLGQFGLDHGDADADGFDQGGVALITLRLNAAANVVQAAQNGLQALGDLHGLGQRAASALERFHDGHHGGFAVVDDLETSGQFRSADARGVRFADQGLRRLVDRAGLVGHGQDGFEAIGHTGQFGDTGRRRCRQINDDVPGIARIDAGRGNLRRWVVWAVGGCSRRRHAVPAWRTHARAFVRHHRQTVGRDGAGAIDHQQAGGVIEAQDVELGARRGAEHVREGDLHRLRKDRHTGRLDRDVKGVLQHARRQHVFDQRSRHGGDAHFDIGEDLPVAPQRRAWLDGQREALALVIGELGRSARVGGGDQCELRGADRLQAAGGHTRQVDLGAVGIGHALGVGAHAAHHRVGLAGNQVRVHHHFGEEHARGGVGGGAAIDSDFDHASRHVVQGEEAVRVGVDELVLLTQDVDLGMDDRQQEDVVRRVDHAVGAAPDVVKGHRQQVRARVDHAAHQLGARHRQLAHGGEAHRGGAAGGAVVVGIQESAIGGGTDQATVHMNGDARCTRHRLLEEEPRVGAVGGRHDGGVELAAVRRGGVVAVGVERGQVDCTREIDQGALRDADVAAAVCRSQRGDDKRGQRVHRQGAGDRGHVAGRIACGQDQAVAAHAQAAEGHGFVERAGGGIEAEVVGDAVINAIAEQGQARARAERDALDAAGATERVAVAEAGERDQRTRGVEREPAGEGCAGVAGQVRGDDRIGVAAVLAAVQREGGGEAEPPGGVEREQLRGAAVDADLGVGHAREVVQHLAGQGQVGVDGRRHGVEHHLGRLHVLRQRELGQHGLSDLRTDGLAGVVVQARVDAAVDAADAGLVSGLAEARERACHPCQRGAGGGEAGVVAEGGGQDTGRSGAEGAVPGHVARVRRGDEQRRPVRVQGGRGVAVLVGVLDRRHGAPEVVEVLGVPAGNGSIGQRHVELRHQACIGTQAVALGCGHLRGNLSPVARGRVAARTVGPELGLLGLVGRARAAGGAAQALHFDDGGRVGGRIQAGRWRRAELVARGQCEGRHLAPLRVLRHAVQRGGGAPLAELGAAVVRDKVQIAVVGPDVDHGARDAVAQGDAGRLGGAVGDGGQAGGERGVELGALAGVEAVEHAVSRLGGSCLGVDCAGDCALHQESRRALDGGQGVVDRNALHGQHAGGHGRVGDVELDGLQRDVDPIQHGIGLHDGAAGQRAGDGLAVAGRIGHPQGDAVVAAGQAHAGQLEHARAAGGAAGRLAEDGDRRTGFGGALQRDDGRGGLGAVAVQRVDAGDAKAGPGGGHAVEREGDVVGGTLVAGRIAGHHAHGVCALAERAACQGVEHGPRDRVAAVGLNQRRQVGDAGVRVRTGVEGHQQLRDAGVVGGLAGDAGVAGEAVGTRGAGVVLQGCAEHGCGGVGHRRRFSHHGQVGGGGVAGCVASDQREGVVTQRQCEPSEAETAVGCCGAGAAVEHQRRAGLGAATQRDAGLAGAVVAHGAGVAGRREPEAGDGWGLRVEGEADVHAARVACRVFGHQPQRVRALGQGATRQRVEQRGRDDEAAVGLQGGGDVGEAGRGTRVERGQQLGHTEVVGGGAGDGRVVGDAVGGGAAGVALQRSAQARGGGVRHRVARDAEGGGGLVAGGIGGGELEAVGVQEQRDATEAETAVTGRGGGANDGGAAAAAQAEAGAGFGDAAEGDRVQVGAVVTQRQAVARRGQAEAGDHRCGGVGRGGVGRGGAELRQGGRVERGAVDAHGGREIRCHDAGAAQQLAADDQFLQALHHRAELNVVAIAVDRVDRVDADVDRAVFDVAGDPHARQRADFVGVGIGGDAPGGSVIPKIGADVQMQRARRATHLQQLQAEHGQVARGIALGDELNEGGVDVEAPCRSGAAGSDAVGTAVHAPQAAADRATDVDGAQGVAGGDAAQVDVGIELARGGERLEAGSLQAAGTRRAAGPGGDVHGHVGGASGQTAVADVGGLEREVSARGHVDVGLADRTQVQAHDAGGEAGGAAEVCVGEVERADRSIGNDAGQHDLLAWRAGEADAGGGAGACELQGEACALSHHGASAPSSDGDGGGDAGGRHQAVCQRAHRGHGSQRAAGGGLVGVAFHHGHGHLVFDRHQVGRQQQFGLQRLDHRPLGAPRGLSTLLRPACTPRLQRRPPRLQPHQPQPTRSPHQRQQQGTGPGCVALQVRGIFWGALTSAHGESFNRTAIQPARAAAKPSKNEDKSRIGPGRAGRELGPLRPAQALRKAAARTPTSKL